jgi:hypothetical protein
MIYLVHDVSQPAGRMILPQTAITCVQFAMVREFRDVIDDIKGWVIFFGHDKHSNLIQNKHKLLENSRNIFPRRLLIT